jgi:hypothetical protein
VKVRAMRVVRHTRITGANDAALTAP